MPTIVLPPLRRAPARAETDERETIEDVEPVQKAKVCFLTHHINRY